MQTQLLPITLIEPNEGQITGLPRNPRLIKDERYEKLKKSIQDAPEMLDMRSLIAVQHGNKVVTICGNMRLRACIELGYTELPCFILPQDTPPEKLREYTIKDNIGYGQTDWEAIIKEWDTEELADWGLEMMNSDWLEEDSDESSEQGKYTRKIDSPIYEPTDRKPDISELADTRKRDELVEKITAAKKIPKDVKAFLLQAAQRHVVFNYKKIGDFYAHSSKNIQELFEQSALVVIDFNKAIEYGFVQLCKEIEEIQAYNNDNDE